MLYKIFTRGDIATTAQFLQEKLEKRDTPSEIVENAPKQGWFTIELTGPAKLVLLRDIAKISDGVITKVWKALPLWMHDYKDVIQYQGPDSEWVDYVEDMMNDTSNIQTNAPRALITCELSGQLNMLTRLYEAGKLGDTKLLEDIRTWLNDPTYPDIDRGTVMHKLRVEWR